jgi:hypothetical protein
VARAAVWLALQAGQDLFWLRQGLVEPRSLADVRQRRRERYQQVLRDRQEQRWLTLLRQRQPVEVAGLDARTQAALRQMQQVAASQLDLVDCDPLVRSALKQLHLDDDRGSLRHWLVDLGQWDPHHLVSMGGTTWSQGFSAELIAEAERLLALHDQTLPGDEGRLDCTQQRCVTIDDDDTRDIDTPS